MSRTAITLTDRISVVNALSDAPIDFRSLPYLSSRVDLNTLFWILVNLLPGKGGYLVEKHILPTNGPRTLFPVHGTPIAWTTVEALGEVQLITINPGHILACSPERD